MPTLVIIEVFMLNYRCNIDKKANVDGVCVVVGGMEGT
jgi:hypothetical protein